MKNFGEQSSALMKEFEGVRKLSCIQANPYRYVRNWFDKKFTNVEVDENGNLIIKTIEEKKAEEGKVVEMPTAQQEEDIRRLVLNCSPFVRQYGILNNEWGVILSPKECRTRGIHRNSRDT